MTKDCHRSCLGNNFYNYYGTKNSNPKIKLHVSWMVLILKRLKQIQMNGVGVVFVSINFFPIVYGCFIQSLGIF